MILTNRPQLRNERDLLRVFGGLNETYGCTEAEYSAGVNVSARNFPALSTRSPRRKLGAMPDVNGMYHLNGLLIVSGKTLRYTPDGAGSTTQVLENAVADSKKTLVGIGTKILIFPDKIAFDTAEGTVSPLGAVWENGTGTVELEPCDGDGTTYTVSRYGRTEPDDPKDGQLFLKVVRMEAPWRSDSVLEVYSAASGSWSAIPLEYCRISAESIGKQFKVWDTITLSGTAAEQADQWSELDGDRIVYAAADNWIRVKATPGGERFFGKLIHTGSTAKWVSLSGNDTVVCESKDAVRLERRVPDLDYLTECDNRVWGCSSRENVIYGSKLGDPTNWFSYRGIAADSYAVTVGSDGPFTGAATCMGAALFFKENALHRLYGAKPSDFQLSSLRCRGVAKNAAKSLCVLNETLYYLSPEGVMAWDGSLPTRVSTALDARRLAHPEYAAGGALDGRYYLHLTRSDGSRLLVYDTERGLWQEENVCSQELCSAGGQLYLWDGSDRWAAEPSREPDWENADGVEEAVAFSLVTGEIGLDRPEEQYLSRLTFRLDAETQSRVELDVSYDGGGWEPAAVLTAEQKRKCADLSFVPRRCGIFRLRLQGRGQIVLRSVARTRAAAKGALSSQI